MLSNSKPVPEGTVIMAESQYAGRGQQQNRWNSEPGRNLTVSLLLNPVFLPPLYQFHLTRVVSIGVAGALIKVLGDEVKIKWPNDIYYGDKKLGGILIENILQGNVIKHAVVGIGLNVNQEEFPAWVPNPVSVKQILHADYDLRLLLSDICKNIEAGYLQLKSSGFQQIQAAYTSLLYWYGQEKPFSAGGEVFSGTVTGVSDTGYLQLSRQGEIKEYSFKEIEFLNK